MRFPSPYGAWVSSQQRDVSTLCAEFPSPYGAWVSSLIFLSTASYCCVSVPLRGMGFIYTYGYQQLDAIQFPSPYGAWVSSIIS